MVADVIRKIIKGVRSILTLTYSEFVKWLHDHDGSITSYIAKFVIAFFVYVIISDYLLKIIKKVESNMEEKGNKSNPILIVLHGIRFVLQINLIYIIIRQLNVVEIDPLTTIQLSAAFFLILVVQGALVKNVTKLVHFIVRKVRGDDYYIPESKDYHIRGFNRDTESGEVAYRTLKILGKLIGIAIAAALILTGYHGAKYIARNSGVEMSQYIGKSDYVIAKETETEFVDKNGMADAMPIYTEGTVTVKSNGTLNIVYLNGKQIGVNTRSSKCKFYGVSVGQSEIEVSDWITYKYTGYTAALQGMHSRGSDEYIYYNDKMNDCLIISMKPETNRVAAVTYYTDYKKISEEIDYAE